MTGGTQATSAFGVMLRSLRHTARMTLEELAEASGVSVRGLGNMERGSSRGPQRRTVDAIADALRLDPEQRSSLQRLAGAGRARTSAPAPPFMLRTVPDFTGRDRELGTLERLLTPVPRQDREPLVRTAVLFGPGGEGKTTLAAEVARRLTERFPDGCVCVQLHGMSDAPLPVAEALVLLLSALGHAPGDIPADVRARETLYRAALADRKMLVILDDAADEAQARPLLPDPGGSYALVTSRRPLAGLEGVHRVRLGEMSEQESATMLERIIGVDRTEGHGKAVGELTRLCGRLPLCLRIVGNRLSSRPSWTPARLAEQLTDDGRRLSGLVAGDLAVRNVLSLSYGQLDEAGRTLLRRLTLAPGRQTGTELAAVLAGTAVTDAGETLESLVDMGLLEGCSVSGRYGFHDLVHLLARERLGQEEPAEVVEAVRSRMADWLLRSAAVAGSFFAPADAPEPWEGETPPFVPDTDAEAEAWLTAERAHWAGVLPAMASAGRHRHVLTTAQLLSPFAERRPAWPEWQVLFEYGARAAAALGDGAARAGQLDRLAWTRAIAASGRPARPEGIKTSHGRN